MDLVKLRHAIAVAREGSYGAAAAKLNLSQPALSRSIQSLEADYAIRLFERGRGGAKLTPVGAEFISVAQNLVHRAMTGDEQLRQIVSGQGRPVSFGLGPITAGVVLPAVLRDLVADGTQLRVRVESVATLQMLLRQGEIEFYVSGLPLGLEQRTAGARFRIRRIPFSGLGLLVRRGHPLLGIRPDPSVLHSYPTACGTFFREVVSSARLARLGLRLPSVELDDYGMLAALARDTDFIVIATTLLPPARPELGLVALPTGIAVDDMEWGLVSSEQDMLSGAASRVATRIFDQLALYVEASRAPESRAPESRAEA